MIMFENMVGVDGAVDTDRWNAFASINASERNKVRIAVVILIVNVCWLYFVNSLDMQVETGTNVMAQLELEVIQNELSFLWFILVERA